MKLFLRRLLAVLLFYPLVAVALACVSYIFIIEALVRFVYCGSGPSSWWFLWTEALPAMWPKPCKHSEKP